MSNESCIACGTAFDPLRRKQGGGTTKLYCSPKCRSRIWARENKDKRKISVAKYDAKPEVKLRKRGDAQFWVSSKPEYKFNNRLKQYGLTRQAYETLLTRQQNACAGCGTSFAKVRVCIDHDHGTGKVRGLLCDACNTGLGMCKESAATLYQLSAYLELDRSKPVIYLVGSLRNPEITNIGNKLRDSGFEVVDNWMAAGPIADDSWQEYSNKRGRSYVEALRSREARHVFHFDKAYLNLSDIVVLAYPAGKSAHMEFGYALGRGKQGYILVDTEQERYDVMLQFANQGVFLSIDDLIKELKLKST